ncbi:MAG: hypothetical protein ACFB2W_14730 [Leptolyngbyaceae cyanobacterium]
MFKESIETAASTRPDYQFEIVRHMLFATLSAVHDTVALCSKLNYAEPHDWSHPLPTGRPNEVMMILTKRVRVG